MPTAVDARTPFGQTTPGGAGESSGAKRVAANPGMLWHLCVAGRVTRGTRERRRVLAGNRAVER